MLTFPRPGVVAFIVILFFRPVAFASDGVLEINQACVQTGCFSGDSAGFPVTIDGSAGQSYVLTGDLSVPNPDTTAVQLSADGISIDLNGFTIRGITTCTFLNPWAVCAPVGPGDAISGGNNVTVRNGRLIGLGGQGLDLGFDSVVESVRVMNNGDGGIRVGPGSSVRFATANANNGAGVKVDFRGGIYSTIATNNNANGIEVGQGSLIRDSVLHSNGQNGIVCFNDCLVTSNEITGNGQAGLSGPAQPDCAQNGTIGYGGNVISRNSGGPALGCAEQVGANLCDGSALSCP